MANFHCLNLHAVDQGLRLSNGTGDIGTAEAQVVAPTPSGGRFNVSRCLLPWPCFCFVTISSHPHCHMPLSNATRSLRTLIAILGQSRCHTQSQYGALPCLRPPHPPRPSSRPHRCSSSPTRRGLRRCRGLPATAVSTGTHTWSRWFRPPPLSPTASPSNPPSPRRPSLHPSRRTAPRRSASPPQPASAARRTGAGPPSLISRSSMKSSTSCAEMLLLCAILCVVI